MSPPRRRSKRRSLVWPLLALVFVCFVGGGAAAWLWGNSHLAGNAMAAGAKSSGARAADTSGLKGMDRQDLEREVARLRQQIDERDKRIADLMIQIKLMQAGSAGSGDIGRQP